MGSSDQHTAWHSPSSPSHSVGRAASAGAVSPPGTGHGSLADCRWVGSHAFTGQNAAGCEEYKGSKEDLLASAPDTLFSELHALSSSSNFIGLLSFNPSSEGPFRKACSCPQSPGVKNLLRGHLHPQDPQALRSSFAWPWSCLQGNRRSGSDVVSRRKKTYSGSCSCHSQSTKLPSPGKALQGHSFCLFL